MDHLNFSNIYFQIEYLDIDFDGTNDLFVRNSASNGYVMSRGYMIQFDQANSLFIMHPELEEYANFRLDTLTHQLTAELPAYCDNPPYFSPDLLHFELNDGTFQEVSRAHQCD